MRQSVLLFLCAITLLVGSVGLSAQTSYTISRQLEWAAQPEVIQSGSARQELWKFKGGITGEQYPDVAIFLHSQQVPGPGQLDVNVVRASYADLDREAGPGDELIDSELRFFTRIDRDRNGFFAVVEFVPIVRTGDRYRKLTDVELSVSWRPNARGVSRGPEFKTSSALRDGSIYKIAVTETGIHKLTYGFLKDQLGINLDNIDPKTIQVLGQGGGMVPVSIEKERVDDLEELAIYIQGEADGRFDGGDYLLFYGEGPNSWRFDEEDRIFIRQQNVYDTKNYYFIKVGGSNGRRLATVPNESGGAYTTTTFDDYDRYEEERVNLLYQWNVTRTGAGQRWFGDYFKEARTKNYNNLFSFPNLVTSEPLRVRAAMALRASQSSRFSLTLNNQKKNSGLATNTSIGSANDYLANYANNAILEQEFLADSDELDFLLEYPHPGGAPSEGWLDYIEVNARRQLTMSGDQMDFRDINSLDYPATTYQLNGSNLNNLAIWNISDPLQPGLQEVSNANGRTSFGVNGAALHQYIAFRPEAALHTPEAIGPVANQNLHALGTDINMLIVYPAEFEASARMLADHRESFSGLKVAIASTEQVYNEFSSGRQDPTAIRDLTLMLFERSPEFDYLLLFGDGSFDARGIIEDIVGTNFIPTYQQDSFNSIQAFPADDFYGILTNETNNPLAGRLNVAVGRLPVGSADDAQIAVDKIIHYDTSPQVLGDWRNRLVFVGDDEDNNRHTVDANRIADGVQNQHPDFNVDKIFLDAYPQVSSSGGDRFPAANEALNNAIFKGTLAMTYLGHGGPKGWAQERVLDIPDIRSWRNYDNLILLVTATCSFTGYDDPAFTSAGEEAFLNPDGGAIALMTTTRPVYASANAELTDSTMVNLFQKQNGRSLTLGQAMRQAKNSDLNSSFFVNNSRKFTLIGDPAIQIPLPEYQVMTTNINGEAITTESVDTLRAFQKVNIEGIVADQNGQPLESFNGSVFTTIFDKRLNIRTLGQDAGSRIYDFGVRKNVIFKGKASVTNGKFRFTFVVPKDINFSFGPGKISYYASDPDNMLDANGAYERIIIGGTSPDGINDDQGPLVEVFMNTEDFAFGGITGEDPTLLVRLTDDNGINVVGNSIGHDLEGVLNEDTENTYVLNDFYEAAEDDYRKGIVRYPLYDLPNGRHQIRVKAWDIANNSSEGYTEFVVANSAEIALEHVLNYPNPFTDNTCFQFDHNLSGQQLEVLVQIYTVSGRLVKTLEETIISDGAIRLDNCISWDGRDEFGDRLARGVYLYRIKVRTSDLGEVKLKGESDFEKLVILK
ncbi:type IX secretion system sortase PorU [Flavilitoribacter nigricans]|uniref:Oxidoreductase n=1 Tax=Flavilitoribacter nigricans (strain ATCC 23147 / DSM 23189 / NBRC 102662 / NCIMB 1420 / SS-2) TaxID=1122177 RepID=A0A2D0NF32_FLAN2|nr:type IX secretion system sortase PorU [Flavilitoribacter nigricans]PHN07095.1 oxidoreductase [Flavilitoribacter nigricans DSM 23189 = NBRC 102662]